MGNNSSIIKSTTNVFVLLDGFIDELIAKKQPVLVEKVFIPTIIKVPLGLARPARGWSEVRAFRKTSDASAKGLAGLGEGLAPPANCARASLASAGKPALLGPPLGYEEYDDVVLKEDTGYEQSDEESTTGAPDSPRSLYVNENQLIWALKRGPRLAILTHLLEDDDYDSCIRLRRKIKKPVPMHMSEYYSHKNKYCVCQVQCDYDFKSLGFILYRTFCKNGDNWIIVLDIIFESDQNVWQDCPEFVGINIPLTCIHSFKNFIERIGYKSTWRKAIRFGDSVYNPCYGSTRKMPTIQKWSPRCGSRIKISNGPGEAQ